MVGLRHIYSAQHSHFSQMANKYPVQALPSYYVGQPETKQDGIHTWIAAALQCSVEDSDPLISELADFLREAYGEREVLQIETSVDTKFDLERVKAGFRKGLPDPDGEGDKPEHLKNTRSETAELLAKKVLDQLVGMRFPFHTQATKGNPQQPVLGFDAGGFLKVDGEYCLALVEVKGTEDKNSPPEIAKDLAEDCSVVPESEDKICRLLSMVCIRVDDEEIKSIASTLLDRSSDGIAFKMVIAPVLVRGNSESKLQDLEPVVKVCRGLEPNVGRGITVSVGADLSSFTEKVVRRARASD